MANTKDNAGTEFHIMAGRFAKLVRKSDGKTLARINALVGGKWNMHITGSDDGWPETTSEALAIQWLTLQSLVLS